MVKKNKKEIKTEYNFKGQGLFELMEYFGLDEHLNSLEEKISPFGNSDFTDENYLDILKEYITNRYNYRQEKTEILKPCYHYLKAVVESESSYAHPVLEGILELYENKKYLAFYKYFISNMQHMWY